MSFVYNEELIKQLENLFVKKVAQTPPQQALDPKQVQNIALGLLNNLKKIYSRVQTEGNADLFQKHLFDLPSLVLWVLDSKTKFDGHQIAYPGNMLPNQLDQEVKYTKLGTNPIQSEPYVWRDGLVGFLTDLRKQASDSGNQYFVDLVGKLINDANREPALDARMNEEEAKKEEPKQEQQPAVQQTTPAQQGVQQPKQENQEVQTVAYQTKEILQQTTGSPDLDMPFDENGEIDIDGINKLLLGLRGLIQSQAPITRELARKWNLLMSQMQQVSQALTSWYGIAGQAASGGFSIDVNTDMNAFVSTYANKDYNKARDMLNALTPIMQGLQGLLGTLLTSPTLTEIAGRDVLAGQMSKAQATTGWIKNLSAKIEHAITSVGKR